MFFLPGLLLSGFTAFAPKFIESQFSISAGLAAQLVGKSGRDATCPTFVGFLLIQGAYQCLKRS